MKTICPYCHEELNYPKDVEEIDFDADYSEYETDIRTYYMLLTARCSHCHKNFDVKEKYMLVDFTVTKCEDEDEEEDEEEEEEED